MTLIDEIKQQPGALLDLLAAYKADGAAAAKLAEMIRQRDIDEFVFTGMGSSTFVGYIAGTLLAKKGIRARAYETREFICTGSNTLGQNTLLFLISQSGTCKEILDYCGGLKNERNIAVVTNNVDKPLYGYGEVKFLLHAGEELRSATKSYTNTVAAILYICNTILESKGLETYDFYGLAGECAKIMQELVEADSPAMADFFADAKFVCMVGGGASYCSACQAEVIIEEAAKIWATRMLPAQFLHGPVELIDEGFNVLAFDFTNDTREEIDRIIDNVTSYGGKICVVTNRDIKTDSPNLLKLKLPVENEFYAPLVEIMPLELFVNTIGLRRGLTPGVLTRVRK